MQWVGGALVNPFCWNGRFIAARSRQPALVKRSTRHEHTLGAVLNNYARLMGLCGPLIVGVPFARQSLSLALALSLLPLRSGSYRVQAQQHSAGSSGQRGNERETVAVPCSNHFPACCALNSFLFAVQQAHIKMAARSMAALCRTVPRVMGQRSVPSVAPQMQHAGKTARLLSTPCICKSELPRPQPFSLLEKKKGFCCGKSRSQSPRDRPQQHPRVGMHHAHAADNSLSTKACHTPMLVSSSPPVSISAGTQCVACSCCSAFIQRPHRRDDAERRHPPDWRLPGSAVRICAGTPCATDTTLLLGDLLAKGDKGACGRSPNIFGTILPRISLRLWCLPRMRSRVRIDGNWVLCVAAA